MNQKIARLGMATSTGGNIDRSNAHWPSIHRSSVIINPSCMR
jgi:hypothetical protein